MRGTNVDDITKNDMFSAHSTWRLHTGTHEADPGDTEEPDLCMQICSTSVCLFWVLTVVLCVLLMTQPCEAD